MRGLSKVLGVTVALALMSALAAPAGASAACVTLVAPVTPTVSFDAVALTGRPGSSQLSSPARMLVLRYLRGSGPRVIRVQTGVLDDLSGGGSVGGEGFNPSAGQTWRLAFRFAHGRSSVRAHEILHPSACDNPPPHRLHTPVTEVAGGDVHSGPLVAHAETGPHGLVCARVGAHRACGIGQVFDVMGKPGFTAVVAAAPDLTGMRVASPDGAGLAPISTNGRVALSALKGVLSPDALGVIVRRGTLHRRVLPSRDVARARDPLGGLPWTARSALVSGFQSTPHTRLCAGFAQDPLRFGTATDVLVGKRVCSRSVRHGYFFQLVAARHSTGANARARTALVGAGSRVKSVTVTVGGSATALIPAVKGGAFLAVFAPTVTVSRMTIVIHLTDGSSVRFVNASHGAG